MNPYTCCKLCPRQCGVDRTAGQRGACGMGEQLTLARAALHFWEEPAISGSQGSGAVFFSGCGLGCLYCQNTEISQKLFGAEISGKRLRSIFEELIAQGAHNINLVTATHFLPSILPALRPRLSVPVVFNSSGYERVDTLRKMEGYIDIYLPDLKYAESDLARRLSGAPDYFQIACAAIDEMVRQTGPCVFDDDGLLLRGTVIRHLILPGQVQNSLKVLDYVSEHFPPNTVYLSLMAQFTPAGPLKDVPPFNRGITTQEFEAVRDWLYYLDISDGWMQEPDSSGTEYIPSFDLEGVFPANNEEVNRRKSIC